jgi:hypothetical protein
VSIITAASSLLLIVFCCVCLCRKRPSNQPPANEVYFAADNTRTTNIHIYQPNSGILQENRPFGQNMETVPCPQAMGSSSSQQFPSYSYQNSTPNHPPSQLRQTSFEEDPPSYVQLFQNSSANSANS